MKSGYASGTIAGFVAGSIAIFSQIILATLELQPPTILEVLPSTATIHIGFNTIWAAVFGILYSKFYDTIPGKGISKGLIYGLILGSMIALWPASYYIANGNYPGGSGYLFTGFLVAIVYGLFQGALYEGPEYRGKIEDKIKNNVIGGTFAGLVGGIIAFVLLFISFMMGIPYAWYWPHYPPITSIANIAVIEIVLMVVWGAVFSIIFALLFIRIPGKGMMKGLYFGLVLGYLYKPSK